MKFKHIQKTLLIIVLSSYLGACATLDNLLKPRVSNLIAAPDFVPEVYYKETFLIAPAFNTFEDAEFTPSQMRVLSNGMQSYFIKKRPGMNIKGHEAGAQELGLEQYLKLSEEFKSTGMLSAASLSRVTEKTGARYVIFTDIMDVEIEEDWSETKNDDYTNVYDVSVSAQKTLTVMYAVVDVHSGNNSWSGVMDKTAYAYKSYERVESSGRNYGDAGVALAVIDVLLGEDPRERYREEKDERTQEERFPAPSAGTLTSILGELHEGFVLNLPVLEPQK